MKRFPRAPLLALLAIAFLCACECPAQVLDSPGAAPKYVFLFIGDGMGPDHVAAAERYAAACGTGGARLRFADFPVKGTASTLNFYGQITDSAAAVTALASGRKTANGVLNMDPSASRRFDIISDAMKNLGRKVGVVTSVSLDNATPAGFYAHSASRDDLYGIAAQLAESGIDYFGGGGFVRPRGADGMSPDVRDIARSRGFEVVESASDFRPLAPGGGRVIAIGDNLDSAAALPYEKDRARGEPGLAEFTEKGIELLYGDGGFLFVVESGKIDWASHSRDAELMIPEVLTLDAAVGEALEFLELHPAETLIVVTSDHETGGLELADGAGFSYGDLSWTAAGHTGRDVDVFALGAGQELFSGEYENTGIFDRLSALAEASASGGQGGDPRHER